MENSSITETEAVLDISKTKPVIVLQKHGYLSGEMELGIVEKGLKVKEDEDSVNIKREGEGVLVKEYMNLHARDVRKEYMFARLIRKSEQGVSSGEIKKEGVELDIDNYPFGQHRTEMVSLRLESAKYNPDKLWHERLHNEKIDLVVHANPEGVISKISLLAYDANGNVVTSADFDAKEGKINIGSGTLDGPHFRELITETVSFSGTDMPKNIRIEETIRGLSDFSNPSVPMGKRIVLQ